MIGARALRARLKLWAPTIAPPPSRSSVPPLNDHNGAGKKLSAAIEERLLSGKGDASLSI